MTRSMLIGIKMPELINDLQLLPSLSVVKTNYQQMIEAEFLKISPLYKNKNKTKTKQIKTSFCLGEGTPTKIGLVCKHSILTENKK